MNNFLLCNVDTDAISVCKNDMSPFSEEEITKLTNSLNSLFPEYIKWEDDGYYSFFGVLKAKNYIMEIDGKIKLKGSSIRDQKKESILKKMLDDMIEDLVRNDGVNIPTIYISVVKEALSPKDIKQWSQKKTLTKAVLDCARNPEARKNERVVYDAIKGKPIQEGDKVYVYPCIFSSSKEETVLKNGKIRVKEYKEVGLKCAEDYSNDADTLKLVDRVYATIQILSNVIDMTQIVDYTLSKNKHLLNELS
jgi:hypothetical protein